MTPLAPPAAETTPTAAPSTPLPRRIDAATWGMAVAVALLFVVPKLWMHEAGHTTDLDTANYSNFAWGLLHDGQGFFGSVLGRHHLGEHFSPVMALLAPIYLVFPTAHVLMVAQGLAVAASVVMAVVWLGWQLDRAGVGDDRLGPAAARWRFAAGGLLLVLALLYPPLIASWATQFQPIELGMPLVVIGLILIHQRRDLWLAFVALVLVSTRESAGLSVIGLGLYAAVGERRWGLGVLLVALGIGWMAVALKVVMPHFRGYPYWRHGKYYNPLGLPAEKALYLTVLIAGLGFLPLVGRRALACTLAAVPGAGLNVATDRAVQFDFVGHYDAQVVGFLLVAAAWGLVVVVRRLSSPFAAGGSERNRRRSLMWATAAGVAIFGSAALCHDAADVRTPFEWAKKWYPTEQRRLIVAAARAVDRKYADAPALAASGTLGPQMCHRPHYMLVRTQTWYDFADGRLLPGQLVVIPGWKSPDYSKWLHRMIAGDARATAVEQTPWIEVYRWPADAPPPTDVPPHWGKAEGGGRKAEERGE